MTYESSYSSPQPIGDQGFYGVVAALNMLVERAAVLIEQLETTLSPVLIAPSESIMGPAAVPELKHYPLQTQLDDLSSHLDRLDRITKRVQL